MNFISFRDSFLPFKIFNTTDVVKQFPGFDFKRLNEWQKKGYLQKIVNKWYIFKEIHVDELLLFRISNCIYRPSYISLQSALSYYQLIPEGLYQQQAITTLKTQRYATVQGNFMFRNMKPTLYFGYKIIHHHSLPILIADMEKALLDYFYLTPSLNTTEAFEALRLNDAVLREKLDWNKLQEYASEFKSKTLDKKIIHLQNYIGNAVTT